MNDDAERMFSMRMPESLHKQIRMKCAEHGWRIADVIRFLLQEWLAGRIVYRPAEDVKR